MAGSVIKAAITTPTPTFFSVLPKYPSPLPDYPPGILEAKLIYDDKIRIIKRLRYNSMREDIKLFKLYIRTAPDLFYHRFDYNGNNYFVDQILEDRDNKLSWQIYIRLVF